MCASKANGGQRCFGAAKKSLAAAGKAKEKTHAAWRAATDAGAPADQREALLRTGMAAEYAYEDALARYASTKKGAADLQERLKTAPEYYSAAALSGQISEDDRGDLESALADGVRMRRRSAQVRKDVRAGLLTKEQALAAIEYPTAAAKKHRADRIERTVANVI